MITFKNIILAAGKGTRMQSKDTHKVCFDIDGKPAIIQAMDRYSLAGLSDFTIVVGTMAEQVMAAVSSKYPTARYAYQVEALGTGNAARIGCDIGEKTSPVLITMGDKIIAPEVVKELISKFEKDDLDCIFAVTPKKLNQQGGNAVINDSVEGIIENLDVRKAQLYKNLLHIVGEGKYIDLKRIFNEIAENVITSERKRAAVLEQMREIFIDIETGNIDTARQSLLKGAHIKLGNREYEPEEIDACEYVNAALYIFKPKAFEYGLEAISTDNAQGEEYLTDIVNAVCSNPSFKVDVLKVENEHDILTYNNVSELIKVQEILSRDKHSTKIPLNEYKMVDEWLLLFKNHDEGLMKTLDDIYGEESLIEERIDAYISVLEKFKSQYGARKVVISRAPGRVNLMGRHVEHRGGCVNVISIDKEVLCVAAPNDTGLINISNTSDDFPDKSFSISEHFKDVTWETWLDYLDNDKIIKLVTDSKGDWMNYVKAPLLKLQYTYKDRQLLGMDMAYTGNIPIAAGLSSSSAIVVSTAEAAVAINNLDVKPQKFVDLCGKGEWFVGSRGGAGDHAAMKYGERGNIASLGFFPFGYRESFPFPEGYKLIIANSFIKANKTTNAKDSFNQRIASYEFGFMMIKDKYPEYEEKLQHLRDINPDNLEVKQSEIYRMLLSLPEKVKPEDLFDMISTGYHNDIRRILKTHKAPEYYYVRSVMMYGVAECRRSFMCARLLKDRDFDKFGQMMKISHDGDRVFDTDNNCDYDWQVSREKLNSLITDLMSEDFYKVYSAQIQNQPGGYACSTKEIDFIVDTVNQIDGVIGSQLSGAGLGGCVMILVRDTAIDEVIETLNEKYYRPNGLDNGTTVCIPVKGSGLIKF